MDLVSNFRKRKLKVEFLGVFLVKGSGGTREERWVLVGRVYRVDIVL